MKNKKLRIGWMKELGTTRIIIIPQEVYSKLSVGKKYNIVFERVE